MPYRECCREGLGRAVLGAAALAAFSVFSTGLGCLSSPHASVLLLADLQLQCYSLREAFSDHSWWSEGMILSVEQPLNKVSHKKKRKDDDLEMSSTCICPLVGRGHTGGK